MRSNLFIRIAICGLFASLAFVTPSQASSYVINVSEQVQIQNADLTSDTISSVEIDYSGLGGSLFGVSFVGSALNFPAGYLPTSAVAVGSPLDGVKVSVSGTASLLSGTIYFDTIQSTNDVTALAAAIKAVSETVIASASTTFYGPLHFTVVAVPEPTSMALLGIGMTGFLAFRRLFKRSTTIA
jgi:hypothetical protein